MTVGLARKLSRTKSHRDALLKNLVSQLFQHESIVSTHEKCKETSRIAERVITSAKKHRLEGTPTSRHISNVQSNLFLSGDNKHLLNKVINDLAVRYEGRAGGYTRIMRLEPRVGDKAAESIIELVDSPVLSEDGQVLQRGNIKFWLLMKTLLYDEISNIEYSPLTLHNLSKLYKQKKIKGSKEVDIFKKEMISVRKLLMEQMNDSDLKDNSEKKLLVLDEVKDSEKVDFILTQLDDMLLNTKQQNIKSHGYGGKRKYKEGFEIMTSRPMKNSTLEEST